MEKKQNKTRFDFDSSFPVSDVQEEAIMGRVFMPFVFNVFYIYKITWYLQHIFTVSLCFKYFVNLLCFPGVSFFKSALGKVSLPPPPNQD